MHSVLEPCLKVVPFPCLLQGRSSLEKKQPKLSLISVATGKIQGPISGRVHPFAFESSLYRNAESSYPQHNLISSSGLSSNYTEVQV